MYKLLWLCMALLPLQLLAQPDIEKKIQTQLILAEDGDVIELAEGTFAISKTLSMEGKKGITIRGKGRDKTILNFYGQTQGAEGIKITHGENITIEDMTVQNSKGDLIKTMHVKGITFRNIKAEWTGKPKKTNGAYALYPVQCENVLIERCEAIGASDAGIYVGQSKQIIVRNCRAYHNVAGIEIENSLHADVYDNESTMNTGGILVFDLPDLIQKKGGHVRVYNNKIYENNLSNFAPKGNIVAKVPKGTGVLILATNNVEIFNNEIKNNKTAGIGIISYYLTEIPIKDTLYYAFPTQIYIHDNVMERRRERATSEGRFGLMFRFKLRFGKNVPLIFWDGIRDAKLPDNHGICISNNTQTTFANFDAEHGFKHKSRDFTMHQCTLPILQAVKF